MDGREGNQENDYRTEKNRERGDRIIIKESVALFYFFLGFGTINSTLHVPTTPNINNNILTCKFSIIPKAEILIIVHIQIMDTAFVFQPTPFFS